MPALFPEYIGTGSYKAIIRALNLDIDRRLVLPFKELDHEEFKSAVRNLHLAEPIHAEDLRVSDLG